MSLTIDQAIAHLLWHAGIETGVAKRCTQRDCERISECVAKRLAPAVVQICVRDIIEVLEAVNRVLNGDTPSEHVDGKFDGIPRGLVFAILEVIEMLRSAPATLSWREDAIWTIETSWRAVIDGDIDDLHEHLRLERLARGK